MTPTKKCSIQRGVALPANNPKKEEKKMPNRDQVERITDKFFKESKQLGRSVSRDEIKKEIVKRAKRIDIKNNN